MKKQKICLPKFLVSLLLILSLVLSSVSVFAEDVNDGIEVSVSEESGNSVESDAIQITGEEGSSEQPDAIQIMESGDIILGDAKQQDVSVSLRTSEEDGIEMKEPDYLVGDEIPLYIEAFNETDSPQTVRLYFWDCNGDLPDDKSQWSGKLTDVCESVRISELQNTEEEFIQLSDEVAAYLQQEDADTEAVISRYLTFEVPASTDLDAVIHLVSDEPETMAVVPVVADQMQDALSLTWKAVPIQIEDNPEASIQIEEDAEDITISENVNEEESPDEDSDDINIEETENDDTAEVPEPVEGETQQESKEEPAKEETEESVPAEEEESEQAEEETEDSEEDTQQEISEEIEGLETATGAETGPIASLLQADAALQNEVNQCFVSAYAIDERIDGSAPFDKDDARGNDSSSDNGIVRSFDSLNYTLKYTTALRDENVEGVDSAYVMVDFVLPCDPSVAAFNMDTLQWCLNPETVYTYEDGTTSTEWDMDKTVVSQRLTGQRWLRNTDAINAIPGTGTLSVGIDVKLAPNAYELHPSFTIWMEGNAEEEKQTVEDTVVVTAAPKFDIDVERNTQADVLGYYDADTGEAYVDRQNASDMYGRLQGYAVALRLYNDSAEKGMRGIEIPVGDITFDLRMYETKNGVDVSYEEEYQPFFWDYRMNTAIGDTVIGGNGRNMAPLGQRIASNTTWGNNMPYNTGDSPLYSCYDGGNMTMVQDASDPNLLHVTLSGYEFDKMNIQFPNRDKSDSAQTIADNIGFFSVGYLQTICRFPTDVEETENLMIGLEASNLRAESMSGDIVTTDVLLSNNVRNATVTTFPKGTHNKRNFYATNRWNTLGTPYGSGNAYAYIGQDLYMASYMTFAGDSYISGTNILQKFDDKVLEIPAGTTDYKWCDLSNAESELGYVNTLFAAKPDKTGWVDDTEMNDTREEQLIYFDSIDELNAAGYTCVGVLYEVRDSRIFPYNEGGGINLRIEVHIKEDTPSGTVAMMKNDVRSWGADNVCNFSWKEVSYDAFIDAYGLGAGSWSSGSFTDGYVYPTYETYTNYERVVYRNGTIVSGHTNSYNGGNSLLVISNEVGVNIQVNDMNGDERKHVYDLDAGERTATFLVSPVMSLDTANDEVTVSDIRDTVSLGVTLPKDLHFQETGVSVTPDEVVVYPDGTTSIFWTFEDVRVIDGIQPIIFSALIGDEGTPNDVVNNQALSVETVITSSNDVREISTANGKIANTSISVVRLAASSVTKRALASVVEAGDEIGFRLRYSNTSDETAENVKLYDILSYAGDTMGSDFTGGYRFDRMTVDYSHANRTFESQGNTARLQVTTDEKARENTVRDAILKGDSSAVDFIETAKQIDGQTIVFDQSVMDAKALLLTLGDVAGNEYIDVYFYLSPQEDKQLILDENGETQGPGDVYGNRFYQNSDNQAGVVISNVVHTTVASREISGLVWFDTNKNGIRENEEELLSGSIVKLYRLTPSVYDDGSEEPIEYNGKTLYPAYDVLGNLVPEKEVKEDGMWRFSHLEAGTYTVLLYDLDDYELTDKNVGDDSTIDSDADFFDGIVCQENIVLPEIVNMTEDHYTSDYHDTGLVAAEPKSVVHIQKVDTEGNPLEGAELALYHAEDVVDGKVLGGAKPLFSWTSEKTPYELKGELQTGSSYTLVEHRAPFGYKIAKPVTFTVEDSRETQVVTMVDQMQSSSVRVVKKDADGGLLAGVTFELTFTKSMGDTGVYLLEEGESVSAMTDERGEILFEDLARGTYILKETKTIKGHMLLPEAITIELPLTMTDQELKIYDGKIDTSDALHVNGVWYFFESTYEITNEASLTMPMSGGFMTWKTFVPLIVGMGILVGLGIIVFRKKKIS